MATLATLLTKIDAAIEALLDAIADDSMESYTINGRSYQRAQFSSLLDALLNQRTKLSQQNSRANSNPVRVAKLGRARGVDR